jgi:hypothetical protein
VFVDFLTQSFLSLGDSEKKWSADQLIILLRLHFAVLPDQKSVIKRYIRFFCQCGFFTSESLKKPDQLILREKLFSLLSFLDSDSTDVWASYAVLQIEKLEEDHKKVNKLDSEIKKIRKAGLKAMKKLRSTVFNPLALLIIADKKRVSRTSWIRNAFCFDNITIV